MIRDYTFLIFMTSKNTKLKPCGFLKGFKSSFAQPLSVPMKPMSRKKLSSAWPHASMSVVSCEGSSQGPLSSSLDNERRPV